MQDVADFSSKLAAWTAGVVPNAAVQMRASDDPATAPDPTAPAVILRLVRLDAEEGPRSREALSRRAILTYRFDLCFADAQAQHQALADLAFGLLARGDLADGRKQVTGTGGQLEASFSVERLDPLPQAKPVREAIFDLRQRPSSDASGAAADLTSLRIQSHQPEDGAMTCQPI